MPLRDDLLDPIAGENPSGPDLRYDPVFDQIKEARREDDDSLPTDDVWERAAKKADHPLVVKLAGEMLARRTKDLRLAANLIESLVKLEGLAVVAPSLELLRKLQEAFWETMHPEIDEGDLQLRVNEVEKALRQLALNLKLLPLTKSGLKADDYKESRTVGYEAEADTDERKRKRAAAVEAKKLTGEAFDKAALETPKAYFVTLKSQLDEAAAQAGQLDTLHRDLYGEQYPEMSSFFSALQESTGIVEALLTARRKIEPDPVATLEKVAEWGADANAPGFSMDDADHPPAQGLQPASSEGHTSSSQPLPALAANVSGPQDAYPLIVNCAQILFEAEMRSPVPYLVCAGLRLGETRMQGSSPEPGFAVGPSAQIRQSLRAFALNGAWTDLLRSALPLLGQPCARAWLDLHRYIWRAAHESELGALASAVCGTLRELLTLRPEVRYWTLEDDTGAANPETQAWIDTEVLQTSSN